MDQPPPRDSLAIPRWIAVLFLLGSVGIFVAWLADSFPAKLVFAYELWGIIGIQLGRWTHGDTGVPLHVWKRRLVAVLAITLVAAVILFLLHQPVRAAMVLWLFAAFVGLWVGRFVAYPRPSSQ